MSVGLEELQDLQTARLRNKLTKKSSLTFPDDLNLQTNTQKGTDTKETTEDFTQEVDFLRKQVETLQLNLSKSTSEVKQKEKELEKLRQALEEERTALSETSGLSGSATQKIVEISRKNRDLHAELAREKNRNRQLQTQTSQLKGTITTQQAYIEESKKENDSSVEQKQKEIISQLEDQLSHTKQKLVEHCSQTQLLKQDLKMAQKVLIKEVGEGVTINGLVVSGEGWRGRAQQIIALQNKVVELQKLVDSQTRLSRTSTCSYRRSSDDKQKATVHKIENENKQKLQELKSELEQLQSEHMELKQQNKALKARNQTLTSEAKEHRAQITSLSSKLRETEKEVLQRDEKLDRLINESKPTQAKDYEKALRHLRSQLSHSEGERQRLQQTLHVQCQERDHQLPLLTSTPIIPQSSSDGSCMIQLQRSTGSEDICLPPIKEVANNRRKENRTLFRNSVSAGSEPHLGGKYTSKEFEQVVSLCRVTEVERDRLLGLSQSLQQRLDSAYSELATVKQQLMTAERSLQVKGQEVTRTKGKPSSGELKSTSELQDKLLLQEDENQVLKETLKLTQQQKLHDMKLLQNLLHETRQTFNSALKQI